jgi:hypothetical protein
MLDATWADVNFSRVAAVCGGVEGGWRTLRI